MSTSSEGELVAESSVGKNLSLTIVGDDGEKNETNEESGPLFFPKYMFFIYFGGKFPVVKQEIDFMSSCLTNIVLSTYLPYLNVYYEELGMTPGQIGILAAIFPFVVFVSGPLWTGGNNLSIPNTHFGIYLLG